MRKMELNEQKHSQAAILGLQHLLAMYSGSFSAYHDRLSA